MAQLKNKDTNGEITRFVSLQEKQDVIRTIHITLDGQQYIQRFGSPTISYELTLYVNEEGKILLMQAEDAASLLEVQVKNGTYYGRITELKDFKKLAGGYYEVSTTLSKVAEV